MTAEEMYIDFWKEEPDGGTGEGQLELMIEFAKYHVEKALEAASNEADITQERGSSGNWFECVDKDSILNSYSLDNIK